MGTKLIIKGADFSQAQIIETKTINVTLWLVNNKTIDASGNVSDETGSAIIVVPVLGGYAIKAGAKEGQTIGQTNKIVFYTSELLDTVISMIDINTLDEIPQNAKYLGYKIKGPNYDNTSKLEIVMPLAFTSNLLIGEQNIHNYYYDDSCQKVEGTYSTGVYISGIDKGIKIDAPGGGTARVFTTDPSNAGASMISKNADVVSVAPIIELGNNSSVYLQISMSSSTPVFKTAENITQID